MGAEIGARPPEAKLGGRGLKWERLGIKLEASRLC